METLWSKCENILRDELTLLLEETEAKLASIFGHSKSNKPVVKQINNQNLKIKQENKENIKKDKENKENVVKTPIKEVLKEKEEVKEETIADILQLLSVIKRPSWSESRDDYKPLVYTSNLIIKNPKADVDLLDL